MKKRLVAAVPFDTDFGSLLVSLEEDSLAAQFIFGFEQTGESPVGAMIRTFQQTTDLYIPKDDWCRFHIQEEDDYIIHWYTTRFAIYDSELEFDSKLGAIRLVNANGWMVPGGLCASNTEYAAQSEPGKIAPAAEIEYIVPMARWYAMRRWS